MTWEVRLLYGVGERKAEHNRIRRRLDDVAGQNGSLVMYNMK